MTLKLAVIRSRPPVLYGANFLISVDDISCEPLEILLLQHPERQWFALYKDFAFDNIAVSHNKEILLIDFEELSIIENLDYDERNGLYGINLIHFCVFVDMKSCLLAFFRYTL